MNLSLGHLGPQGTYAEAAALAYAKWLHEKIGVEVLLSPYPSIAQTITAVAENLSNLGVIPVENSIEGGVTVTLDTLWKLENLQIQHALVLPIVHALISQAENLNEIRLVYSHPQALAQCQLWLAKFIPQARLIPANSTTEGLDHVAKDRTVASISSQRAAGIYKLPILAQPINDYPDNHTRFWVLSQRSFNWEFPGINPQNIVGNKTHTSLAFSLPANIPGALVKTLQILADNRINMSRIESRPTKRSLGEYLFFIDIEANATEPSIQTILGELEKHTETLKILGTYNVRLIE